MLRAICLLICCILSVKGIDDNLYTFWNAQCDRYYKKSDLLSTEFPHMVNIGFDEENSDGSLKKVWLAGASLVTEKHVLTSASSTYSRSAGPVKSVRLGTTNFATSPDTIQVIDVERIIIHPNFNNTAYDNIAVLLLKKNVTLGATIRPVCFEKFENLTDKTLIATGWGVETFASTDPSKDLKKIQLTFTDYERCKKVFPPTRKLREGISEEQHICAAPKYAGKDTCQGDSGGPLQIKHSKYDAYNQIGITSFGKGCGFENIPGVYMNVTHFLPWIRETISAN